MIEVGNAPLSWGVFEGDAPTNPSWCKVLDEIARAGYHHMELGPVGFLPEDPDELHHALDARNLGLTAGFVYEHMHDLTERPRVLETTRRVCQILSRGGASKLVVIDRMTPDRQLTAGRSERAQRLGETAWNSMVETIEMVAAIADEFGLRPVLHPHCGAHIEFEDEIERALTDLSAEIIGLCIDTGHAAVAGMQAKDLVDRYPERVEYFHFKDVDPDARGRLRSSDKSFDEALSDGLFCAIGSGIVDFEGLKDSLDALSFSGQATVEQDPDPTIVNHNGYATAVQSLDYLREIGLADSTDEPAGGTS